jgi:site-specific recombinase XerD
LEPPIIKIFQEHRKRQLVERMSAGKKYQNNNLVFCTLTGEPLSLTNVHRRNYRPIITAAKLKNSLTLYSLRHSFATLSLAANVEPKIVSYDLGHESVAFTLDVYCKVVEKMRLNAEGKLDSILFPKAAKASR